MSTPARDETPFPLWELVQTHHVVARAFRTLFAAHGLTPSQFGVLACLADGDDFTKAELARAVLVTPQSMDPLIDDLLTRGLVVRDLPARRGRASGVRITADGRALLDRVRPEVATLNSANSTGLPASEAAQLVELLRRVRRALDAPP